VSDLFTLPDSPVVPLAEKLRPHQISEVMGQHHLLGEGKPLQLAFAAHKPHSMILWGPPGVGKTTLARLMAKAFQCEFIQLSAVFSGVKEIREAIDRAKIHLTQGKQTILFVDEVHRFNKSQQDAFLPFVESGVVTFIGATTENPSFEVNSALLSRTQVYVLQPLTDQDMYALLRRAQTLLPDLSLDQAACEILIGFADGDARKLLNLLEQSWHAAKSQQIKTIDSHFLTQSLSSHLRRFDKGGEQFYDQISALHKSVRGSHPDAALYWLHRMLEGGADPRYIARRLIRMAWEDIGLADPRAAQIALTAAETYERLGSPEGELALSQAIIYMAVAPKSNAGYKAHQAASKFVRKDRTRAVPIHLRNAPTKLMDELGYGHEYRYAHDEPEAYAAGETYLPDDFPEVSWYCPTSRGLEGKIADKMKHLRELDLRYKKKPKEG
jgi:putative ATPase